jgi:hypothetical protein
MILYINCTFGFTGMITVAGDIINCMFYFIAYHFLCACKQKGLSCVILPESSQYHTQTLLTIQKVSLMYTTRDLSTLIV